MVFPWQFSEIKAHFQQDQHETTVQKRGSGNNASGSCMGYAANI